MARTSRRSVRADRRIGPDDLMELLKDLPNLSREALVARWTETYGPPPPKGMSRRLIERAVAYDAQAQVHGALSPTVLREMRRHLEPDGSTAPSAPKVVDRLAPGTRLIREWNGRTHTVEVTDSGMLWNGGTYRSLSAVARAITGARWSGPRFFGL